MNYRGSIQILILSNDIKLSQDLQEFFKQANLKSKSFPKDKNSLDEALKNKYPLIIIDTEDDDFDEILTNISFFRKAGNNIPIIIILKDSSPEKAIKAYKAGVNICYKGKVNPNLLLAKTERLLNENLVSIEVSIKDILIQPRKRKFFKKGKEINLTRTEFDFLLLLFKNNGSIVRRDYVINNILNYNRDASEAAVDTMVSRIRKKIGPGARKIIETVPGQGYRLGEEYLKDLDITYK